MTSSEHSHMIEAAMLGAILGAGIGHIIAYNYNTEVPGMLLGAISMAVLSIANWSMKIVNNWIFLLVVGIVGGVLGAMLGTNGFDILKGVCFGAFLGQIIRMANRRTIVTAMIRRSVIGAIVVPIVLFIFLLVFTQGKLDIGLRYGGVAATLRAWYLGALIMALSAIPLENWTLRKS